MSIRCFTCHRRLRDGTCPSHGRQRVNEEARAHDIPPEISGLAIRRALGVGGFAVVWEAIRESGERVAIKVARANTSLVVERFRREANGMRAVGASFVPQLFEHAVLPDGRPYLVMELLDGETLADWLGKQPTAPTQATVAPYVDKLVEAVEAVHAAGQVHRDLKPENVMLAGDRVALLDLGLAAEAVRARNESLTRTGTIVGTTEYMAPERLLGQTAPETEAAGDVYALGVMLFEIMTLRLPFVGDAAQIELGHLTRRPPRLREFAPVSAALEEIVLACLAKDPARRPSLRELRASLRDALSAPVEAIAAAPRGDVRAATALKQPVVLLCADVAIGISGVTEVVEQHGGFVAREKGDRYVAVFAGSLVDEPAAQAFAAANELAKSGRVALHIATVTLRRRGEAMQALGAAIERPESWVPDGPGPVLLTEQVAGVVPASARPAAKTDTANDLLETLDVEVALAGRDAELARIIDAVREAFAIKQPVLVTIVGEGGVGKSRMLREVAAAMGERRAMTLLGRDAAEMLERPDGGEGLRRAAEREPMLVCVDDVQLASSGVLDAIEYATLSADHACGLAVIASTSPRLEVGRKRWGARARHYERVALDALGAEAASTLAAALLAPAEYPSADALRRLADWSGGNPARLVELVRTIKREGYVRRSSGRWYLSTTELDKLPRSAPDQWIAARALEALAPELADVGRICAVIGARFDRDEVARLIDELERAGQHATTLDVDVALAELARRGILVPGWRFRSEALQEAIYGQLAEADRRNIHRVALELARRAGNPARVARHAAGAGERAEAANAYIVVGEQAHLAGEQVRADEAFTSALALADEPMLRERALAGRGRARWRIYRTQEAVDDLAAARELANARGGRDQALDYLLEEATALDWEHEQAEGIRRVELAAPLAASTTDERLAVRYKMALGRSRWREEAASDAIAVLTDAARDAERIADRETQVTALLLLACALAHTNDVAAAEARFDEVIALTTRLGDRLHLCAAYGNRLFLWMARGQSERAVEDLRHAIQLARELGNPNPELAATFNLGELLLWAGDDEGALSSGRRALDLAQRFSDAAVPFCHLLIARGHAMRDEVDQARAALELVKVSQDMAASSLLFVQTLRLAIDGGERWQEIVDEARAKLVGEELIEVLYWHARVLLRCRERDAAQQQLDEINSMLARWPIWRRNIERLAGSGL